MFDTNIHVDDAAKILAGAKILLEKRGKAVWLPARFPKNDAITGKLIWSGLIISVTGHPDLDGKEYSGVKLITGEYIQTTLSVKEVQKLAFEPDA
jgi:hypothetical protein